MDPSVGVVFQLLQITFSFMFLVSSMHANVSPVLRSPEHCFEGGNATICGLPLEYPLLVSGSVLSESCGYPGFQVDCGSYRYQGTPFINASHNIYHVLDIDYTNKQLQVVDINMEGSGCLQPKKNFSLPSSPSWVNYHLPADYNVNLTIFYNCSNIPFDAEQHLVCTKDYYKTTNTPHSYAFYKSEIPKGFDWYGNCAKNVAVPTIYVNAVNYSETLKLGFYMGWSAIDWCEDCERSGGQCWSNSTIVGCACKDNKSYIRTCLPLHQGIHHGLKIMIGVFVGIGGLILLAMLFVYKRNQIMKKKNRSPIDVKEFLESYRCLSLKRYTYSDVKKMTNSFKEKLGEGGYGKVFKGKLHDGRLVAVKVLNESKGDGKDFINEVVTIGRTNHVNVVTLVGFCIEGAKRALVYEFMPNGSLERFIYTQKEPILIPPLGWEKIYEIALGIARGLEYLHRGCNTRILHFDIKPHNILLDQHFCPKISDFGLAKLYPTRASVVSTVGARGTMGYIAPELCCRNFGGVSHKSDVYSYGMMMLEMIGGRKNIDTTVENISEIYFPFWIYNHLMQNTDARDLKDIQFKEVFENENAKKMTIVALWCIQAHPGERPSMNKVVEMLEGKTHDLQLPPNPSLDPRSTTSTSS